MWNRQTPDGQPAPGPQPGMPALASMPSSSASSSADERRVVAWVGKSVVFKGELTSSEDMTIDGRVEGTIQVADHDLVIGPDADIRADITAATVRVRGKVTGTIVATQTVELCESAAVEGDVFAPRLA